MPDDKTATDQETETTDEDDSMLDELIESIEEVVEKPVHWLFGKMFGKRDA